MIWFACNLGGDEMCTNRKVEKVLSLEDKLPVEQPSTTEMFSQHQRDFTYQYAVFQLNRLLENSLISIDEYHQMEQEIRQ